MSERRVGLIGALLVAIGPVSMALYTPAMPDIVREFAATDSAVKLTLTAYFGGFAITQLVCGPLSDGFGRKPVTFAFITLYVAASLLAMLAPTVELLIVARLLQGIGASVGVAIARAVVRDCFTGEASSRIMNLMGIVLALGPAVAPTIGSLTLVAAGWRATFLVMTATGIAAIIIVLAALTETGTRDTSRIRPRALATSFRALLKSPRYMGSGLTISFTLGTIYAQAPLLPFILMNEAALTPVQFGFAMICQSGSFLVSSLVARALLARLGADRLVPFGLGMCVCGALLMILTSHFAHPTILTVMMPVGLVAAGIAFVLPGMMTAALAPFPAIAGAASALLGFFQMTAGMAGSGIATLLGDPFEAMGTIIPAMILLAVVAYWIYLRGVAAEPDILARRPDSVSRTVSHSSAKE